MIGQRLDIEKARTGKMARAILLRHIAQVLLARRCHTGVEDLNFRVVDMLCKPVARDKKGCGHGVLRVIAEKRIVSAFSPRHKPSLLMSRAGSGYDAASPFTQAFCSAGQ